MNERWAPIASFGDTPEQVTAALLEVGAQAWQEQRVELRRQGFPLPHLEVADVVFAKALRAQVDRDLPLYMRDLELTAPGSGTRSH